MTDLIRRSDVPDQFTEVMHMAQVLAESNLLPAQLRQQPANVLLVLTGARALDVPAFWALQSMHVIEGKLSMAADLMRAVVNRAGHRFRVVERTRDRAVVEIHRKDRDQPYRAEFTRQDAKDAKLLDKQNWQKYPAAMLVARATAIAVRDECPELLYGMVYSPDELGAVTDEDGNPADVVDGEVVPSGKEPAEAGHVADDATDALGVPVDPEGFLAVWSEVARYRDLTVPMRDGLRLANVAADIVAERARTADTAEVIRRWYTAANAANLLDRYLSPMENDRAGDPPIMLGNYLKGRGQFVAGFEAARADIQEQDAAADPQVIDAEVVEEPEMVKSARDSWGDGPVPPTTTKGDQDQ